MEWPPFASGARELENARRRLVLGNLSGLWDAMAACSTGPATFARGLACPDWLAARLLEAVAESTPAHRSEALGRLVSEVEGSAIPAATFEALSPIVLRFLRAARCDSRGRHSRWWARWRDDLADDERAGMLESLRARRGEECSRFGSARAEVEALERLPKPQTPELARARDEALLWQRFLVRLWGWSDDSVSAAAGKSVNPPVGIRTIRDAAKRVREVTAREPWRYARGALAWILDRRRDDDDPEARLSRQQAFGSWLLGEFENWKKDSSKARFSCRRVPRGSTAGST